MPQASKLNEYTPLPTNEDGYSIAQREELVAAGPDEKNWRGIGIALVVIVCVCALIVTAVVLLTPGDRGTGTGKTRVSLDDVVSGAFGYRTFNGSWISNHEFIFSDYYEALEIYNVLNNSHKVIMPNTTFRQNNVISYSLSADRNYVLLAHKYQRVYRYTYKAAFLVYNVSSEYISPLFPSSPDLLLQYAAWGPTGNQLVYVLDNNVFYMQSIDSKSKQLTTTGVKGVIYNGVPDWVYEEEVLSDNNAIWWAKDGTKLCFATFNDTDVDEIMYPYYGSYKEPKNAYPEIINLKYPKAGKTNPTVELWVIDFRSGTKLQLVKPPKEYQDLDYYFTQVQWVNNDSLSVIWLKRSQNSSIISICSQKDRWQCYKNFKIDVHGGWVQNAYTPLVFSSDRLFYFTLLSGPPEGNAGSFQHVAMINVKTGERKFLTSGRYDVSNILSYNEQKNAVYYLSSLEDKPTVKHLFSVSDITSAKPKAVCITCDRSEDCLYYDAKFASDANYYALDCYGPGIPRSELRSTIDPNYVRFVETNKELQDLVEKKAIPRIRKLQVPIADGYHAEVKMLLPPGLREDEITKYPMVVEVYGAPASQIIRDRFTVNWGTYLASKRNIIYTLIDGRGSSHKGDKFLYEPYRRLGTVEVFDQIAVTQYLKEQFSFIDDSKIAVFGWSYGGFVTAMILANDNDVFHCGISVAPVTSWLYYDSAYTERYMQSPSADDNLVNYQKSEVMRKAENFKGKKYLLVHGTADDNVHWQQSALLAKALADAGVIFRMQVYPDEQHALNNVKLHLYQTIDEFLMQCFSGNEYNMDIRDS